MWQPGWERVGGERIHVYACLSPFPVHPKCHNNVTTLLIDYMPIQIKSCLFAPRDGLLGSQLVPLGGTSILLQQRCLQGFSPRGALFELPRRKPLDRQAFRKAEGHLLSAALVLSQWRLPQVGGCSGAGGVAPGHGCECAGREHSCKELGGVIGSCQPPSTLQLPG